MAKRKRSSRRHRNPGAVSLSKPIGFLGAGFKTAALSTAAPVAVGIVANYYLRSKVAAFLPASISSKVSTGLGSNVLGLATGGAMLLVPKYGRQLFAGAVTGEVLRLLNTYVMKGGFNLAGLLGLSENSYDDDGDGMSDFETVREAMAGIDDYEESMSDFETVGGAKADTYSW